MFPYKSFEMFPRFCGVVQKVEGGYIPPGMGMVRRSVDMDQMFWGCRI